MSLKSSTSTNSCAYAEFCFSPGDIGKQKSKRASTDHRRDVADAVQTLDVFLDVGDVRCGAIDMSALGQPIIHHELGPGGVGKEALFNLPETR